MVLKVPTLVSLSQRQEQVKAKVRSIQGWYSQIEAFILHQGISKTWRLSDHLLTLISATLHSRCQGLGSPYLGKITRVFDSGIGFLAIG